MNSLKSSIEYQNNMMFLENLSKAKIPSLYDKSKNFAEENQKNSKQMLNYASPKNYDLQENARIKTSFLNSERIKVISKNYLFLFIIE